MLDLPDADVVAVDTETSGLHPDDGAAVACVAVAWMEDEQVVSRAFPFDQGVRDKLPYYQTDLFDVEDPNLGEVEWDELMDWLAGRKLVFHHAKYDLIMLAAGTRNWNGRDLVSSLWWDTMLAAGELDPREERGLSKAAARAGLRGKDGLEKIKEWNKAHKLDLKRYDLAPWSVVEPYVTTDAEQTIQLYEHQRARVNDRSLAGRLKREFELTTVLVRMEQRGVPYDAETSIRAAVLLEARASELEAGLPFSPPKLNQAKAYFFDEVGLEPREKTEKKKEGILDLEQLRKWAAEGVPHAKEYLEASQARRAVSMWYRAYPGFMGADKRLRTVFKHGHVKSGRMSVQRVQLQALAKADKLPNGVPGTRDLVRPEKGSGKRLWNLDLAQAELRVATLYAGCERMATMLREGADIHGETTQTVLGASPDDPDWKLRRDIGKRLTFSAIFQIGGAHFQEILRKMTGIELTLEECHRYVHRWRQTYPEFEKAYYRAMNKAKRSRWVPVLPGTEYETKAWFASYDKLQAAWNRTVQGSLAEAFKLWMLQVEREWPGTLILTVHDSVLLELPADDDETPLEVARAGTKLMSDLFGVEMPVEAELWTTKTIEDNFKTMCDGNG